MEKLLKKNQALLKKNIYKNINDHTSGIINKSKSKYKYNSTMTNKIIIT